MRRRTFLKTSVEASLLGSTTLLPSTGFANAPLSSALTVADVAQLAGKADLTVLNDRPVNAETPAHLLNDVTTPTANLFVRNNGLLPFQQGDVENWRLQFDGESCVAPQSLRLRQLKEKFPHVSYDLQLECGGNGRSEFRPRASGNQWSTGAIGCPNWTGVRLKDVLDYLGIKNDAVYVGYVGADRHLSGDANKQVISRGVPIHKALEAQSLLAFELNGQPIPAIHGGPLRLVCAGWPGSVSGKWLSHLLIRNQVHDGAKMGGSSYRIPCESVAPGAKVLVEDMCIIESMPVKSLITSHKSGITVNAGSALALTGQAWAGDLKVSRVEVSKNFGQTWQPTELATPPNRLAWQQWQTKVQLDQPGYYELWARATDELGQSQPMVVPGWNPKGYLNNACHRIAVAVV